MRINLSDDKRMYEDLKRHIGHNMVCVGYGYDLQSIGIECETCCEILICVDKPNLTYEVIEDNGGGLHLVVFDGNGDVTFYASGYEHMLDNLRADIDALRKGDDTDGWDTNGMSREEMRDAYKNLVSFEHGWNVVADEDGVFPMRMGTAARLAFGIEED